MSKRTPITITAPLVIHWLTVNAIVGTHAYAPKVPFSLCAMAKRPRWRSARHNDGHPPCAACRVMINRYEL